MFMLTTSVTGLDTSRTGHNFLQEEESSYLYTCILQWTQKPKHRSNCYGVKDEHTPLTLPAMVARTHMHMARSAAADAPLCAPGCLNVAIAGIHSTTNCNTTDPSLPPPKTQQTTSQSSPPSGRSWSHSHELRSGTTWTTHPIRSASIIRTTTSLSRTSAQRLQVMSYILYNSQNIYKPRIKPPAHPPTHPKKWALQAMKG